MTYFFFVPGNSLIRIPLFLVPILIDFAIWQHFQAVEYSKFYFGFLLLFAAKFFSKFSGSGDFIYQILVSEIKTWQKNFKWKHDSYKINLSLIPIDDWKISYRLTEENSKKSDKVSFISSPFFCVLQKPNLKKRNDSKVWWFSSIFQQSKPHFKNSVWASRTWLVWRAPFFLYLYTFLIIITIFLGLADRLIHSNHLSLFIASPPELWSLIVSNKKMMAVFYFPSSSFISIFNVIAFIVFRHSPNSSWSSVTGSFLSFIAVSLSHLFGFPYGQFNNQQRQWAGTICWFDNSPFFN